MARANTEPEKPHFIDLERLMTDVATELKERGFKDEIEKLRRLYRTRRGKGGALPEGEASDELGVIEWACLLCIPPFDRVFIEQPRSYSCACLSTAAERRKNLWTMHVPSGSCAPAATFYRCRTCGAHWLTQDLRR
ncbi:MAG: hypothetical protein RL385_160 [Pseudomonadota bacterium]